jgi:hypothetical protein
MYGDFARVTFDPSKRRTRVLMQQGRVQTEAELNELQSILLDFIETLARDLIGPHGGPQDNCGFDIITEIPDEPKESERPQSDVEKQRRNELRALLTNRGYFLIGRGDYYVDGKQLKLARDIHYVEQPDLHIEEGQKLESGFYLAYLKVWESYVSAAQDESILEVAFGGGDTATRARTAWALRLEKADVDDFEKMQPGWETLVGKWQPEHRGLLKARATPSPDSGGTDVSASPRRMENLLYRVEVHDGGSVGAQRGEAKTSSASRSSDPKGEAGPTCKFSRVNGSAICLLESVQGAVAVLKPTIGDARQDLHPGDLVEVIDDVGALRDTPGPLRRVLDVDPLRRCVTLEEGQKGDVAVGTDPSRHPFLRRWDGFAAIREDDGGRVWLPLGDGVQIQFVGAPKGSRQAYRSGDFWWIATREATGVEWVRDEKGNPRALPPAGVHHSFAPLAMLSLKNGVWSKTWEGRFQFKARVPAEWKSVNA